MIVRDGKVAMLYFQTVPQRVKVGDTTYDFSIRRNICMAWVAEEHASAILGIVKVCCGGSKQHPYRYANEMQVRVWSGESER